MPIKPNLADTRAERAAKPEDKQPASTNNPLKKFVSQLSPVERTKFAKRAKTSQSSIRITANAYRTGKVAVTAEFAGRLADASGGALLRAQLSPTCAKCPHSKRDR